MSNGSGTVIVESGKNNGPFNNKYKLRDRDKEEESYGFGVITQSPSDQNIKSTGIQ